MRIYRLALTERAVLTPVEESRSVVDSIENVLPSRIEETAGSIDTRFSFYGKEARVARFPPSITNLENLISCYAMLTPVANTVCTHLGVDVQRFPVSTPDEYPDYEIVHPCGLPVSVDESKATVMLFPSTGRIYDVTRYAFEPDEVEGRYLFRANMRPHIQLCTEEFRQDASRLDWESLIFVPVWDSDHEPFAHTPDRDEIASRPEIYGPDGFKSVPERLMPEEWRSR